MDIEVSNLSKTYITVKALRSVSLSVDRGESVGLVGANGAGKTTLLHILMGFLPFDEGSVKILDKPSARLDAATKERIGFVAEETGLLPWATLMDMAELYKNLYPTWDEDMLDRFIDEWDIVTDKRMRSMSKGQKRLAELALCFSCNPEILVLDEPFVGLDAVMRFSVLSAMKTLNAQQRTTIFYSSHILSDIEKIAKRVIFIRGGKISLDEQIASLKSSVEETFIQNYGISADGLIDAGGSR
ncbi:MAG: ABC transporter ATP-binding protein [Gemmatimonadota bacterium]|nr:MAG: ABC transporter ATP-binding protein [Gemmatimonadota bacterium]